MKTWLLAILLAVTTLSAQTQSSKSDSGCEFDYSRIYVNPQVYYLKLDIQPTDNLGFAGADQNVDLGGVQGGFISGYEYKQLSGLYTNLKVEWNLGSVSGNNVVSRMVHDETAEARFGYNYVAMQGDQLIATPYSGFGFNYKSVWGALASPQSMKYYSYYVPVGLMLEYLVNPLIHVGLDFTWLPQVDATVKIKSIDGSRWVLKNKSGFSVELPLIFDIATDCCCWDIRLVPFWKRLKDGSTTIQAQSINLGFPEQIWIYWGGRLDLGMVF